MTLWLILTILMGGAALIVLAPFFFGRGAGETPTSLDVYRDQLAEVERDKAAGQIDEAEAASARLEIERRILAAGRSDEGPGHGLSPNWQYRMATGVAAIVVLGSVGLYSAVGRPDLSSSPTQMLAVGGQQPEQPASAQQTTQAPPAAQQGGDVNALVQKIKKRVEENPQDADSWRMLGWSYYNTGNYKDAVNAYRRAVDLQKDNPAFKALLGEAMVMEAGDTVTDAALATFEEVLAIAPNDERARFFKGVAKAQKGNVQGAIDEWIELYKVAPSDAEWTGDLRTRIEETAKQTGIDVSAKLAEIKPAGPAKGADLAAAHPGAAPKPGPTPADLENAKQMKPEDQQAMAASMVDRLASRLETSPKDADGWIMLMRSRMVMNDPEKARAAFEKAKTIFAGEPETQKRILQAAEAMGVAEGAKKSSDAAPAETTGTATANTAPATADTQTAAADAAKTEAPVTPGPTAADVENASQMKPEDRQAMAAGMVDRLAGRLEASPKDADGWIMLMRSRMVMKDADKARADLEKAKTVFADDPETQKRILQAAQELGVVTN